MRGLFLYETIFLRGRNRRGDIWGRVASRNAVEGVAEVQRLCAVLMH